MQGPSPRTPPLSGPLWTSLSPTLPDDSTNSRELIEFADRALYRAKAEGRNRVVAYRASMIQINQNNILHMEPKSAAMGE